MHARKFRIERLAYFYHCAIFLRHNAWLHALCLLTSCIAPGKAILSPCETHQCSRLQSWQAQGPGEASTVYPGSSAGAGANCLHQQWLREVQSPQLAEADSLFTISKQYTSSKHAVGYSELPRHTCKTAS